MLKNVEKLAVVRTDTRPTANMILRDFKIQFGPLLDLGVMGHILELFSISDSTSIAFQLYQLGRLRVLLEACHLEEGFPTPLPVYEVY